MDKQQLQTIIGRQLFDTTWDSYLHPYAFVGIIVAVILAIFISSMTTTILFHRQHNYHWRNIAKFWLYGIASTLILGALFYQIARLPTQAQPTAQGYVAWITNARANSSEQLAFLQLQRHWLDHKDLDQLRKAQELHDNAKWQWH